jgi:hypothetical protein
MNATNLSYYPSHKNQINYTLSIHLIHIFTLHPSPHIFLNASLFISPLVHQFWRCSL